MLQIKKFRHEGSAANPEDADFVNTFPPQNHSIALLGVIDGVSSFYAPPAKPRMIGEKTDGQWVSYIIKTVFESICLDKKLDDIIGWANTRIAEHAKVGGLDLEQTAFLPSASLIAVKVDPSWVHMIQIGDCLAVGELNDGRTFATSNMLWDFERMLHAQIAQLMEKHGGNREAMWAEFGPILIDARQRFINKVEGGFSVLNGQPGALNFLQRFNFKRDFISKLIIFSDGLVPLRVTNNKEDLASYVLGHHKEGGLEAVFAATAEEAKRDEAKSHTKLPEATAIAITF